VQDVNPLYGRTPAPAVLRPAGVGASNIHNLADFMPLRSPARSARPIAHMQQQLHHLRQDDIRVNDSLTLNAAPLRIRRR
jgi:hypothetical protein